VPPAPLDATLGAGGGRLSRWTLVGATVYRQSGCTKALTFLDQKICRLPRQQLTGSSNVRRDMSADDAGLTSEYSNNIT
jgi:hypothetical protein